MALRLDLAATRAALTPQGGTTHLRVTVTPSSDAVGIGRQPVALALVVDRSGSMNDGAGPMVPPPDEVLPVLRKVLHRALTATPRSERRTKMSITRDAAERLVDAMADGDRLALISFSDVAQLDLPLTPLATASRTTARAAIRGLRPDAMTNLHDGLRLAFEQFDDATRRSHICKVLVITDGLANVGITSVDGRASVVQPAAVAGCTVSAIGVGLEYNSAVLGAIGRAGNGEYYHIETAIGIDALLQRELLAASAVSIRGVEVEIGAGLVAIGPNLNGYTQTSTPNGVRIMLGDLARERAFWLELTSPVQLDGDVLVTARATGMALDDVPEEHAAELLLAVAPDAVRMPEHAELVRELADVIRAQGVGASAELYDSGDIAGGQRIAQSSMDTLEELGAVYAMPMPAAPELQKLAKGARTTDRRMLKQMAASSFAHQRGRSTDEDGPRTA